MKSDTTDLARRIDELFDSTEPPAETSMLIDMVMEGLDGGKIKVVEKHGGRWTVNAWVKKAILLYFRISPVSKMDQGDFYDNIPLKLLSGNAHRNLPYSSVRRGAYIGARVVIMAPSFVNIGAYVDDGAMVDSLVLVGSCARVGKNVHLGAGTILGGVLEPPNSTPVIIEDNAFIGGNCGIYEGCLVEENAVIGAGTIITKGTPVVDIQTGEEFTGRVPRNAVVVPGGRQKVTKAGDFYLQTPLIIKSRDPSTSAKLALEDSLRMFAELK